MARRKTMKNTQQFVTPANGITRSLQPLTFGSYIPPAIQSIIEETDTSSLEDEVQLGSIQQKNRDPASRRLQFSEAETSNHPTPINEAEQRNRNEGKSLNYVPPMLKNGVLTVKIEEEDIKDHVKTWESALIGFVVGETPTVNYMENFVEKEWKAKPKVLMHDEGYFAFKFLNKVEKERILEEGPYYINSRPLVLKEWELDFVFDKAVLSSIPIWVKFPGLPVGYWSVEALSKVASAVGKPIHTDNFTANADRISYARILVEVDVSQPLPDMMVIETPSGPRDQPIDYDWKPKYCNDCLKFGHTSDECWYKETQEEDENDDGQMEEKTDPKVQRKNNWKQRPVKQLWKAVSQERKRLVKCIYKTLRQ